MNCCSFHLLLPWGCEVAVPPSVRACCGYHFITRDGAVEALGGPRFPNPQEWWQQDDAASAAMSDLWRLLSKTATLATVDEATAGDWNKVIVVPYAANPRLDPDRSPPGEKHEAKSSRDTMLYFHEPVSHGASCRSAHLG